MKNNKGLWKKDRETKKKRESKNKKRQLKRPAEEREATGRRELMNYRSKETTASELERLSESTVVLSM